MPTTFNVTAANCGLQKIGVKHNLSRLISPYKRTRSDNLGISDPAKNTIELIQVQLVANKLGMKEGTLKRLLGLGSLLRFVSNNLGIQTVTPKTNPVPRRLSDNLAMKTIAPSRKPSVAFLRAFSNNLGFNTPTPTRKVPTIFRPFSNNLGMKESLARIVPTSFRTLSDKVALRTIIPAANLSLRAISDNLALITALSRRATPNRALSDNVALRTSLIRLALYFRVLSDSTGILTTIIRQGLRPTTAKDSLGLFTPTPIRISPAARKVSSNLGLVILLLRLATLSKKFTDNLGINDPALGLIEEVDIQLLPDKVGVSELVKRTLANGNLLRILTSNLGITTPNPTRKVPISFRTLSDKLAILTSLLRQVTANRIRSDKVGEFTSVVYTSRLLRKVFDNVALREHLIREFVVARLIADRLAAYEVVFTRFPTISRLVSDNLGLAEIILQSRRLKLLASDKLGLSMQMVREVTAMRLMLDNIGERENVTRYDTPLRTTLDKIGIQDIRFAFKSASIFILNKIALKERNKDGILTPLRLVHAFRQFTDKVGLQDTLVRNILIARFLSNLLAISETVLRKDMNKRKPKDSVGLRTFLNRFNPITSRTTTDKLALKDFSILPGFLVAFVSDMIALRTSLPFGASIFRRRLIGDNLAVTESPLVWNQQSLRRLIDKLALKDSTSFIRNRLRSVSDKLGLLTILADHSSYARTLSDKIGVSDTLARQLTALRLLVNLLDIRDLASTRATKLRKVSDKLALFDRLQEITRYLRFISNRLAISDNLASLEISNRSVRDAVGLREILRYFTRHRRNLLDKVALLTRTSRTSTDFRVIANKLGVKENVLQSMISSRTVSNLLGLRDLTQGKATKVRFISDLLAVRDVLAYYKFANTHIQDLLALKDKPPSRVASTSRKILEAVAVHDTLSRKVSYYRHLTSILGIRDPLRVLLVYFALLAPSIQVRSRRFSISVRSRPYSIRLRVRND